MAGLFEAPLGLDQQRDLKRSLQGYLHGRKSAGSDTLKAPLCPSQVTPGTVIESLGTSGFSSVERGQQ